MGDAAAIRNSDYLAMRKWLKEVYVIFPSKPGIKGKRPPASIEIENIPISYAGKNSFSVRVYNPAIEKDVSKPRSALLMFHGGGWIHGLPEMDEGTDTKLNSHLPVSD
jgi:acetyl esterase/lipase